MYLKTVCREVVQHDLASYFSPHSCTQKHAFLVLMGGGNLESIKFPNHLTLHMLIRDLAQLFQHCYMREPTNCWVDYWAYYIFSSVSIPHQM